MRVPLEMIFFAIAATLLIDGYLWFFVSKRIKAGKEGKWTFAIITLLCWLLLAVALSMPRRSSESSILPVIWMLYSYITIYVSKFVFVLVSLFGYIPRHRRRGKPRVSTLVGLVLSAVVCVTMIWGATGGRSSIVVTECNVSSDRLPASFDGYKIVQFSDAHVGTWGEDTLFVSRMVDSINALKPDVIFFTGDVVNRNTSEIIPFIKPLSRLRAKDGVYSILGNHDYGDYQTWDSDEEHIANNEQMARIQKKMGWKLLKNNHVFLTRGVDSIPLIGVENWGEPPFGQYGNLDRAYPSDRGKHYNQNDSLFKILLSHNPEHWRQVVTKSSNIDLTLSGHTHAMQFMVSAGKWRWSPARYKYEQWGGKYTVNGKDGKPMVCYVNIGSGEVGLPFRIGATPEITLITLNRSAK